VRLFPGNMMGPQMLRKFPPQTNFMKTPMPMMNMEGLDKNQRRDYYGERLYAKISSNPQFANFAE
jgi:hypothetical protein